MFATVAGIVMMIVGFGVLIFVHELGHFVAAKWAGIRTEAFAVGMGPVMASWRKGVGFALGSTERRVVGRTGKKPGELTDAELSEHGIGETEYSLRWLPIGGFVKMLGQEDANPQAVSNEPRSYTMRPVGKRMIVVSAGVVMNVLLAFAFFITAFMVGVRFEAPVLGPVSPRAPAGQAVALNADVLGIEGVGLAAGDRVLSIDGKPARTFSDVQIATAMAKRDTSLVFDVERQGVGEPLTFSIVPQPGFEGLLSIGVTPAFSTDVRVHEVVDAYLAQKGLAAQGAAGGMRITAAAGKPITTYGELAASAETSEGEPIMTRWTAVGEDDAPTGPPIDIAIPVIPQYEELVYADTMEPGLLGMPQLIAVAALLPDSPNQGVLEEGDVVLRVADIDYPRRSQLVTVVEASAGRELPMLIGRGDEVLPVTARVSRKGMLGIGLGADLDSTRIAAPVPETTTLVGEEERSEPTPIAVHDVLGGSWIAAVGETPVSEWADVRAALQQQTAAALAAGRGTTVELAIVNPTPDQKRETLAVTLDADDVRELHELGWMLDLDEAIFEPIYMTMSAGGNPLTAVKMGIAETHKMIVLTYLTFARLVQGSVGVKQLRGPVGIIDLGAKILPRGFMWFLFFLGMISVNLAVINFLPIPIVDGGLFLFLVYEKIKGRPPSIQFQNLATIAGLCLIGTVFLVTFYNDIMRLL